MTIKDIPLFALEILKRTHTSFNKLSAEDMSKLFSNTYDIFDAPELTDSDIAISLINKVISNGKLIVVATDYDSDGLNGGAVAYKALKHKCSNFIVINNKRCHGNGFNPVFVNRLKAIHDEKHIGLIITVDHGSSNKQAFKELKDYGIDHIIITDHHEIPKDSFPDTVDVFINPQKAIGDPIGMCGTHVLFKILSNLYTDDKDVYTKLYLPCLPHVAIATVSDVMDLSIPYNRLAVRAGLQIINRDTGLWSDLKECLNIPIQYCFKHIGFNIAPFINTGNRVSREELFFKILIEESHDTRMKLISEGLELNIHRKKVKKDVLEKLLPTVDPTGNSIVIITNTKIAINGIIASSLGEQFSVPVVCFTLDKATNTLYGSARGILKYISVVNIFNNMKKQDSELFKNCGGHKGAGGCSIPYDKFDTFKELFSQEINKVPVVVYKEQDNVIIINTKYLDYGVVEDINYCGPYGMGWQQPLLRGKFKIRSVYFMATIAMFKLITASGRKISGTYFIPPNIVVDELKQRMTNNNIVTVTFEPQYYKRYSCVSMTLLISKIERE